MPGPVPSFVEPRRVPPLGAFLEGWRRVLRAPVVLFGVAATVWLSWELVQAVVPPVGLASEIGTLGWWLTLFCVQLQQVVEGLAPEMAFFFHPFGSLPRALVAVFCAHGALWLFLSGGVIDRCARGRPIGTAAFFAACGVYFFRFLRLAAVVGLVLYALLRAQWAFPAVEMRVAVLMAAALVWLVADFAKARAVIEDRHSMLGALAASGRFIRRRIRRVAGLMGLNALAILIVVRFQMQLVSSPAPDWLAPMLHAGAVLLGVSARLACVASEAVFFQGELAHAGYTAAPTPLWPDSPAVEAMDNLMKRVKE